jgi:hypothetical protein
VTVQLSFDGGNKKLCVFPIDLNTKSDGVIPYINGKVIKNEKHLDPSIHEMEISTLNTGARESTSSSLGDLDYTWDAMVDFKRENRTESNKADFISWSLDPMNSRPALSWCFVGAFKQQKNTKERLDSLGFGIVFLESIQICLFSRKERPIRLRIWVFLLTSMNKTLWN